MTPFDPVAFVAMLNAFYPSVTRTSLERAFRERPEYFAGGYLFGRLSDVLVLPDGRAFDIVYAAWTAASRWIAIYLEPNAVPGDDPFPLEPGPLVEVDVDATLPPPSAPIFESLVAGAAYELRGADDAIGLAALTMVEGGVGRELVDALDATLAEAQEAHYASVRHTDGFSIGDLVERTDGFARSIDNRTGELPDPPSDIPTDPPEDPGPPPGPYDPPPDTGPPAP